jgi:ribose transport system substrate-binding protein
MRPTENTPHVSRRSWLQTLALTGGTVLATSCAKRGEPSAASGPAADYSHEEYVWMSCHANLPLFMAHDHPALRLAGKQLGVQVTIGGPNTSDIPSLISYIETTAARRPAGMMVVAWDPSAVVAPINKAVESGIPVVCVDTDAPDSKRLSFIGTNWFDLGLRQGQAMVKTLAGRQGKVAMLGLTEHYIDQQAFAGFRSVAEKAGLTLMEPQNDRGDTAVAARVAATIIQATPDLVGMAGFDSESGPGMGLAIKEAGKAGQIVATCVDAEPAHLNLIKEGVLTAAIGQKRELFTYFGLRILFELNHSPLKLCADDKAAGIRPAPDVVYTGSYTVTRDNVDIFIKRQQASGEKPIWSESFVC